MKFPLPLLLIAAAPWLLASPQSAANPPATKIASDQDEQQQLSQSLAEAGNSPVDYIRALEKHLQKYPNSARRNEIERALVKAAIEAKDDRRIIEYGERVLARETDDAQILDKVVRALLASGTRDNSLRALKYAKHYEELLNQTRIQTPPGHLSQAHWREEVDKGVGRVVACEARATGNLGRIDEAVALAQRSYEVYPSAESAREIGRWLVAAGRQSEAIPYLAAAFSIADSRNSESDHAKDRAQLGEIYRKLHGSEKGLGDVILEAYDRTSGELASRRLRLNEPNSQAHNIREFTISGMDGHKLPIASLKGKAVVFDFWATWCAPCRAQHPLYEQVKQRFHNSPDVVFLSVNTDDERELVPPFLKESQWDQRQIYYDDGLARVLGISSIPTTIVLDRQGEVVSRMNGFLPERFVDMLSDRIRDALKN